MKPYYIRTETYGSAKPHIIDEETMYQAEHGMNYLNPDDFMFLCEDENMAGAKEQYWEEFGQLANDRFAELMHP